LNDNDIEYIVIHASETRPIMDVGVEILRDWHTFPHYDIKSNKIFYLGQTYKSDMDLPVEVRHQRGRGWTDVGYHYVIKRDGTLEAGRPLDVIGSDVKGLNNVSWGICLIGGVDENNNGYIEKSEWLKECPCFEVSEWWEYE